MAAEKKKKKAPAEDALPDAGRAREAFSPALDGALDGVRSRLRHLSSCPPQLMHIEGGSAESRIALARWWAALLNCREADAPCMACPSCARIALGLHQDSFFFDGREEAVKIDGVRALRPVLGEKPHFAAYRTVIFAEAQEMQAPAANSLLKILEEPIPDTCFVFTVPQRERLLPTIVSRGWVITLPQALPKGPADAREAEVSRLLGAFLAQGAGWYSSSFCRKLSAPDAQAVILAVQKALAARHAGSVEGELAQAFSGISDACALEIDELCRKAQEALLYQANPTYAADALAANLFLLLQGAAGGQRQP